MAIRRMFSKDVVGTDSFLDMPISAQALFFHLGMEGDDDGFVKNPKTVMRMIGAKPDDLNILNARGFIIPFQSGVIAIRHWRILNTLRNDRYHATTCTVERGMLKLVGGVYSETDGIPTDNQSATNGIPMVADLETEHNITEQNKTEHNRTEVPAARKPSRHKHGEYQNVLLSDDELAKLKDEFPNDWAARIERLSAYIAQSGKSYKSHLAVIRNWARRDGEQAAAKKAAGHGYQEHSYTEDDFGADFYYDPSKGN